MVLGVTRAVGIKKELESVGCWVMVIMLVE